MLLVLAMAYAAPTAADDQGTSNNGEDFTRPVARLDLRQRYERLPDNGGLEPEKWVTTLRTDLWTGLGRNRTFKLGDFKMIQ